jgi:serine phosphatase RsbU (regulator of sigma subunit)
MRAANAFLLRQDSEEAFATAVHLLMDVETGHYVVTSAGHPPALRWHGEKAEWILDDASGMALGVTPDADFDSSHGQLAPGEALLFYTDGVVEARGRDLEDGISWLLETARQAVQLGFEGAAGRILRHVPRGQDDRAVLIIERVGPPMKGASVAKRWRWWAISSWTWPRLRRLRLGQPLE